MKLLVVLALGGSVLLAIGLNDAEFEPAVRYANNRPELTAPAPPMSVPAFSEIPAWKLLALWALMLVIIGLVASMLSAELRKRLLRMFIQMTSFVLILLLVLHEIQPAEPARAGAAAEGSPTEYPANPGSAPAFEPPSVSGIAAYDGTSVDGQCAGTAGGRCDGGIGAGAEGWSGRHYTRWGRSRAARWTRSRAARIGEMQSSDATT
jgi:hypothetical protein